ncbi:MAG: PTS cellobiose transporter subunit IIC [Leptotrichiaceae bacterium]|nr:PTS cellobiose transporter subunit IIC [Leptotrichiaceae bacterium]
MANFMDKFTKSLEEKLMPMAAKVANQRHLAAIKDGIIITVPIVIIGSVFLILAALPIPAVANFYATPLGATIQKWLLYPVSVTFDMIGIITCMGVAYRLSEYYKLDGISGAIISFVSFLLVTPFTITFTHEQYGELTATGIPLNRTGSAGLFVGIIMAILAVEIFNFIVKKNLVIKMPDMVPPAVSKTFVALIPGFIIVLVSLLIRIGFENTGFGNVHEVVTKLLTKPLTAIGGSYFGVVIVTILIHLLWTCGLHGANIVTGIVYPALYVLLDENRLAFSQGQPIPHVVTPQFFDIFQSMGGSGATFSLALMLLFWAKSKQLKEIGKLSIGPACFNINEPILFGLPIVMNPLLIIPFILAPLAAVTITYWTMKLGIVARPTGIAIPWTTPPIISGYLVTGGKISGAAVQVVNFFVTGLIYYPFFKMWDSKKLQEESGEA